MHDATVKVLQDYAATLGDRELVALWDYFRAIPAESRSIACSVDLVDEILEQFPNSPLRHVCRDTLVAELIIKSTVDGVIPIDHAKGIFWGSAAVALSLACLRNRSRPQRYAARQIAAKAYGPVVEALVMEWGKQDRG